MEFNFFFNNQENKKEIYDQYGKDGLERGSGFQNKGRFSRQDRFDDNDYNQFAGFYSGFRFRSPQDIFEEFFGTKNIFDIFDESNSFMNNPSFRIPSNNTNSSSKKSTFQPHQRQPEGNSHSNIMQAFFGLPSMQVFGSVNGDMFDNNSFGSSFSNPQTGTQSGVVKSTSRSTKMINGKKYVTTK